MKEVWKSKKLMDNWSSRAFNEENPEIKEANGWLEFWSVKLSMENSIN
jgi:hypothetical protein